MNFKNWREIRDYCEKHGHNRIVKRMELNNRCWNSSGEFGRSQMAICDAIRFADDIEAVCEDIEEELKEDELLKCL